MIRLLGWSPGAARDRDAFDRIHLAGIASLAGLTGLIFGGALGFLLFRWSPFRGALVLGTPMGLTAMAMSHYLVEKAGDAIGSVHNPGGEGTPYPNALSRETALIVAGRFEEAVAALAEAAARKPDDPRPMVMLAELYRFELGEVEEAAAWYRRAAAVPGIPLEMERQILRDLMELCSRLGRPELAAPSLARTARRHEGDRLGYWARHALEEARRELSQTSAESRSRNSSSLPRSSSSSSG